MPPQRKVPCDETLLRLLANPDRTIKSIADEYGLSRMAISKHAKRLGLSRMTTCRLRGTMPTDAMLMYLYIDKRLSLKHIALDCNVSHMTVRRRLIALDILRSKSEGRSLQVIRSNSRMEGDSRNAAGYSLTYLPSHPRASHTNGSLGTHILVVERKMGRCLTKGEVVHHIDYDKSNNNPDNLFVCQDNATHMRLHGSAGSIIGELTRCKIIFFKDGHYFLRGKDQEPNGLKGKPSPRLLT